MMHLCPCCNRPLPNQARRILDDMRMTPQQRSIMELLDDHLAHWVHVERIIGVLHENDLDGGPASPLQGVRVQICKLRRRLIETSTPLQIETDSLGYGGRGYRLIVTEATDG